MNLFDSSALISFLTSERGADVVERELSFGGACSAVNWSEIAQKHLASGRDWVQARTLLLSYELRIEPVRVEDAELAAQTWRPGGNLSIADRLCLATGQRLGAVVWTADAAWGSSDTVRQIR